MGWTGYWQAVVSETKKGWVASALRGVLTIGSFFYDCCITIRNWSYDRGWLRSVSVSVPVISVGNLTVGGTGKTPFVAWLARWLSEAGFRVGVLSRGYAAQGERNDEGLELAWELPAVLYWQGANRVALAQWAVSQGANVLILDDGMQHRRLKRDLEIVLLDATDPWGGGYLLPRGRLREPPTSLYRANVIVITRADLVRREDLTQIRDEAHRLAPHALLVTARHRPISLLNAHAERAALATIAGRKVLAFCGIGQPLAFLSTLRQLGAEIISWCSFPDHFAYGEHEISKLACWVARHEMAEHVLTTRKDLVKIPHSELAGKPLWAVEVAMEIMEGGDELQEQILRVVQRCPKMVA